MQATSTDKEPACRSTRRPILQLAGAAAPAPFAVLAENDPDAPIRVVIPLLPGSVLDTLARGCSECFRKDLGQPLVAENVPGYLHAPTAWSGMFVPAQTPKEIVAVLNRGMRLALGDPDFAARMRSMFLSPVGGPPEAVTATIRQEREVTRSLPGRLGLVPQ